MVLDFTLPAGLVYSNDDAIKIALVSPGADILSSSIDPVGNTPPKRCRLGFHERAAAFAKRSEG